MLQFFGYFSGILILIEFITYIRNILYLKTKPQRTTWFIYAVLGSIAFFSQLAKGASHSLWLPGVITVGVTTIFFLSLTYGVGGFKKKDYLVLFIAALGLLGWYITKEAAIALYIVIIIDIAATWLTIEKAYHHPQTEVIFTWVLGSLAGIFAMLAVGKWDIILLSYPLCIAFIDAIVVIAILLGEEKITRYVIILQFPIPQHANKHPSK